MILATVLCHPVTGNLIIRRSGRVIRETASCVVADGSSQGFREIRAGKPLGTVSPYTINRYFEYLAVTCIAENEADALQQASECFAEYIRDNILQRLKTQQLCMAAA